MRALAPDPASAAEARTTVGRVFQAARAAHRERVALETVGARERKGARRRWTFGDFYADSVRFGRALLGLDVRKGQRVLLLGEAAPQWHVAFMGCLAAGAVPAAAYPAVDAAGLRALLELTRATVAVVQDEAQLAKVAQFAARLPLLRAVLVFESSVSGEHARVRGTDTPVFTWESFKAMAETVPEPMVLARQDSQKPAETAVLVLSSGTTDEPRAYELSHDAVTWAAEALRQRLAVTHEDVLVSFMPPAHHTAQAVDVVVPMLAGARVCFGAAAAALHDTLVAARPTVLLTVPRVWGSLAGALADQGRRARGAARAARWLAAGRARAAARRRAQGRRGAPVGLGLARRLVLRPQLAALGLDRLRVGLCCAAPLPAAVGDELAAAGALVVELYGQAQVAAAHAAGSPLAGAWRPGSVGRALPGCDTRIDPETGDVMVRGRHVCSGMEEWHRTGDVGWLDEDGFLYISGRVADTIRLEGGSTVVPAPLERAIVRELPEFTHALLVGRRSELVALLAVPCEPNATGRAKDRLGPAVLRQSASIGSVATTLAQLNACEQWGVRVARGLKAAGVRVAEWRFVRSFSQEGGQLTAFGRVRRGPVSRSFLSSSGGAGSGVSSGVSSGGLSPGGLSPGKVSSVRPAVM